METFYIIALSITAIALIILLSYVGMQMAYYRNEDTTYPPVAANCPDFWKANGNGKCTVPDASAIGGGFCGNSDTKVNPTGVYLPIDTSSINSNLARGLTNDTKYPVEGTNIFHTFMNIPLVQANGKNCTVDVTVKYDIDGKVDGEGNAKGKDGKIDKITVNTHGTGYIAGNATIAQNALGQDNDISVELDNTTPTLTDMNEPILNYNVNQGQLQLGNIYNNPTDLITASGKYTVPVNTDGSGTGCKVEVETAGNTITSVKVLESGSGYKYGDKITIPPNLIGGSTTQTTATFGLSDNDCIPLSSDGDDPTGGIQNIGSIYNDVGTSHLTKNNTHGYDASSASIDFSSNDWGVGASAICKKKIWASQYGLVWDGITNYNGC